MKKVLRATLYVFSFLTALIGLHFAFDQLQEYHTAQLVSASPGIIAYMHTGDHVAKKVFHAGDVVYMHVDSKRTTACTAEIGFRLISEVISPDGAINRTIYDSFGVSRTAIPKGHYVLDTRYVLPSFLASGDYIIERSAFYVCDSFRVDKSPRSAFQIE